VSGPVDQGQTYRYRQTVSDSNGNPANAGTVVVTITLPDLSTTAPAVVNSSTGVYDIAYTTSQVGLHNLKGSATGGVLGSETDVWEDAFTVEEPKRIFIGLDEASNHLRAGGIITTDADREQLRWLCEVASEAVENELNRIIAKRTFVETYDGGYDSIRLRSTPVVSITTVTESGTTIAGTGYLLDKSTGMLYRGTSTSLQSWAWGRQNIVVTYIAGYTNPPRTVRLFALNIVQELWQETQQAPHPFLDQEIEAATSAAFSSLPMGQKRWLRGLKSFGTA
jgi:hypothetical protein